MDYCFNCFGNWNILHGGNSVSSEKDIYALELAKHPNEPLKAALVATNNVLGDALRLMAECTGDPAFADRQRELVEAADATEFIPSKELVAFEILTLGRKADANDDFKLRAYRLFAEVMGFIKTGGAAVQVNNLVQNRVMVVTRHATEEDWEASALTQQTKLIDAAYSAKKS